MTTDRETILSQLRAMRGDLGVEPEQQPPLPVARVEDTAPQSLLDLFVTQAELLQCRVDVCASDEAGIEAVLAAIADDTTVASWDLDLIPLPGLRAALAEAGITATQAQDAALRAGLTGADAAIAATGSLVLASGPGKPRHASLLPDVHIVVLRQAQIVATMEDWQDAALADSGAPFSGPSQVIIVSGASRTADIGLELVLGAHGPRVLQIVILP